MPAANEKHAKLHASCTQLNPHVRRMLCSTTIYLRK